MKKSIQIASVLLLLAASTAQAKISFTYLHNDALGSPVVATDENGTKLWEQAYKPYGQRYQIGDTNPTPKSYTGHVEDMESGLTYMQARYYNPVLGRFMAVDPVRFEEANIESFGRYLYAANNPYVYTDPDGKKYLPVDGSSMTFINRVNEFIAYHKRIDPDGIVAQVAGSSEIVYFQESSKEASFSYSGRMVLKQGENGKETYSFGITKRVISISTDMALKSDDGVIISPAWVFMHESGHVYESIVNPKRMMDEEQNGFRAPGEIYAKNRHEIRVIRDYENPARERAGLPTRKTHKGRYIKAE